MKIDGRIVRDPRREVVPERTRIQVDGKTQAKHPWRAIVFHKPRGVVTTARDPQGRRTIYDVIGDEAQGLIAVGRLDLATSGLLILTNDTQLANRITDPDNAVPRVYLVSVRGAVTAEQAALMETGVISRSERLRADAVVVRKASGRESHLTIELREGQNREVRRLCEAVGHEVTRLKRIRFGSVELGSLPVGAWRELTPSELRKL